MTKARHSKPPKLKVYQAKLGFYESVVAAANQSAALRAWGTHQNLFAEGGAEVATEPLAIEAALAQPGVPLRRALGSTEPFSAEPGLPRFPDLPRTRARPKAVAPPPVEKPAPADRSALDAAETALATLASERRDEEHAFRQRRAALDQEEAAARRRHRECQAQAQKTLERERRAYVKAGGRAG